MRGQLALWSAFRDGPRRHVATHRDSLVVRFGNGLRHCRLGLDARAAWRCVAERHALCLTQCGHGYHGGNRAVAKESNAP